MRKRASAANVTNVPIVAIVLTAATEATARSAASDPSATAEAISAETALTAASVRREASAVTEANVPSAAREMTATIAVIVTNEMFVMNVPTAASVLIVPTVPIETNVMFVCRDVTETQRCRETAQAARRTVANTEDIVIGTGERIDDLQRNGLKIIQNPERFCFGMDAVLLSGYVTDTAGQYLDLGTGNGIIPLLLSAKTRADHLTGLEIQDESADLAERSVKLNGLEEKIAIVRGDIKEADKLFAPSSFDVITSNPPYMIGAHGLTNPDAPKAIARHEVLCTFEDIARVTERLLKPGGHFYLVHRPFRLAELMVTLSNHHLEPKRMRLVHPFADREPNMVLLDCVRGARPRITVEKPLIIYKEPGVYADEIYDVYGY